jgi:ribosomal subunit interface protein
MEIHVSSKKITLTDAIEQYAVKKLQVLEKFFNNITKVEVIVGMETKHHQKGDIFFAECKLAVPGTDLFAKSEGTDMYQALDLL